MRERSEWSEIEPCWCLFIEKDCQKSFAWNYSPRQIREEEWDNICSAGADGGEMRKRENERTSPQQPIKCLAPYKMNYIFMTSSNLSKFANYFLVITCWRSRSSAHRKSSICIALIIVVCQLNIFNCGGCQLQLLKIFSNICSIKPLKHNHHNITCPHCV